MRSTSEEGRITVEEQSTLDGLQPGQSAIIREVGMDGALRQHFLDMGVIPDTPVTMVRLAPMGDPMEVRIHGYELTLRREDAAQISVVRCSGKELLQHEDHKGSVQIAHPGFGEEGKYHVAAGADPLPQGEKITFALVGNQNSGKTTLFNRLTGSNQHVGNFPGVTVDRKEGEIIGYPNTLVTDLPGIYSMSPYSGEEVVSRNFVLQEKPKGIINIVDMTNVDRGLYLTIQLLELGIPMVVALNMMDEMLGNGGSVDINAMESMLGVPVVPISAAKNEGVDELIRHAVHVAKYREPPQHQDFCDVRDYGGAVHRALHGVTHLIEDHALRAGIPVRFAADKLIEGDEQILESLALDDNEQATLNHIVLQMEKERDLDRSAAIADMRYTYIQKVVRQCVKKPGRSREHIRSQRIDRILIGKYTALPVFVGIMAMVFYLTFFLAGPFLQGIFEWIVGLAKEAIAYFLEVGHINPVIKGLIEEGILEGVGSVLSFLPIIVVMFFFLSMLEDSGYIARVAFFMDKLLRRIGLSGRSIVPMLIGFGCTVPAVMSTRTLPSARDRRMTILLTPFMSCTAKLPIYGFFVNTFFPDSAWWIIAALYVLGIVVGIVVAGIYRSTLFRGEAVPFVMELPNYRLPQPANVWRLLWEKAKDFLQRAFSVILLASIIVWFLRSFDFRFNMVADERGSILATLAGIVVPLMRPAGLDDWRLVTSLVCGFMAKESVVATMEVLFKDGPVNAAINGVTAASMLVFSLLYTPCVAAIASIRREMGSLWAVFVVLFQCGLAWLGACVVYWLGTALQLIDF